MTNQSEKLQKKFSKLRKQAQTLENAKTPEAKLLVSVVDFLDDLMDSLYPRVDTLTDSVGVISSGIQMMMTTLAEQFDEDLWDDEDGDWDEDDEDDDDNDEMGEEQLFNFLHSLDIVPPDTAGKRPNGGKIGIVPPKGKNSGKNTKTPPEKK
jgi:hypothetical protein